MTVLNAIRVEEWLGVPANHAGSPHPASCLAVGLDTPTTDIRYAEVRRIRFSELCPAGMGDVPDTVLAPLFATEFDALDLVDRLATLKFRGVVLVLAPNLPNRGIVLRELQSAAGKHGISVSLIDRA